jgi:hypothetical protein
MTHQHKSTSGVEAVTAICGELCYLYDLIDAQQPLVQIGGHHG